MTFQKKTRLSLRKLQRELQKILSLSTKKKKNFNRYLIDINGTIYDTKYNNREICKWIDNVGYYQCNLYKDGKRYFRRVHKLTAETFIDNPDNLPQVNHKDGNKLNNNINNQITLFYHSEKT